MKFAKVTIQCGDRVLIAKRFMPVQPEDSPFILPSESQAEIARRESAQNNKNRNTNHNKTMPDISTFTESKYLKRADVGAGKLLTIQDCGQQNVAKADQPAEMKWCLHFAETDKPLVLNRTNAELIGMITGERNSDNWGGHKVVLYDDPSISYGGKLVGGIRVRAPRNKTAAAPAKPPVKELPQDEDEDSSDIPF